MTNIPYKMRRRDALVAVRDAPAASSGEVAVGSTSPSGDRYAIPRGNRGFGQGADRSKDDSLVTMEEVGIRHLCCGE